MAISILILFCVLAFSAGHLFRWLNLKILRLASSPCAMSSDDFIIKTLEQWRRQHALVCRLVDELNDFFGTILLVASVYSFLAFITNSFEVALAFKRSNWALVFTFLCRFCLNFYRFATICIISWFMESEVFQ